MSAAAPPAENHDQVPATHNKRSRGKRPVATFKYLRRTTSGIADYALSTTANYPRGAAGIGLGTTFKYLRRSTCGAARDGLCNTIKSLRGAACIGLGTTIKYLRRTTYAAAGNGLAPRSST
jgi:hypothetical protein